MKPNKQTIKFSSTRDIQVCLYVIVLVVFMTRSMICMIAIHDATAKYGSIKGFVFFLFFFWNNAYYACLKIKEGIQNILVIHLTRIQVGLFSNWSPQVTYSAEKPYYITEQILFLWLANSAKTAKIVKFGIMINKHDLQSAMKCESGYLNLTDGYASRQFTAISMIALCFIAL